MMAVERWRQYLLRGPFVIKTDHKSLCHLDDQHLSTELQKKAMTKLIGLQYKFQYKHGPDNKAADALSRIGHFFALQSVSVCQPAWVQEVLNSYHVDDQALQLLTELAVHSPNSKGFSLDSGLIRKKGKVWIGSNSALQSRIIAALHDSALGGHSGIQATYQRVKKVFAWTGLKVAVEEFVKQCGVCQQAKHDNCKYPGLLQPLPVPMSQWQDISLDFIEGLPLSDGYSIILVVVDQFTKYSHFIPLKHPFTAQSVAKEFMHNIVRLHGLPRSTVSDRDKVFTSSFW
uniref:Integrase catalytic domain-containing protein n=1 Tax=Arundo donax TaxID=35708 RepID=A0A0A8YT52_ARUDO